MASDKGGLMQWQADCGHWMVVHSLAPTPAACPDCSDILREDLLRTFVINPYLVAESEDFCADEFPACPEALADVLGRACETYDRASELVEEAQDLYDKAERDVREAIDKHLPEAERLFMPEPAK